MADSSSAIILKLFESTVTVPLQVDPRPLRTRRLGGVDTSEDALLMAAGPVFGAMSEGELAGRVAALRRAGLTVGDISALDKCPGILGLATAEERKACPTGLTAIAAFGVLDSTAARAVVQVVVLGSDRGKFGRITPYEMELRQGRWVLVKLGQTVIVE